MLTSVLYQRNKGIVKIDFPNGVNVIEGDKVTFSFRKYIFNPQSKIIQKKSVIALKKKINLIQKWKDDGLKN